MIDIQTLLDRVAKTDYKDVIEDPEIGLHPNQSEFLVFLKPEIFMGERSFQEKRVQMINDLLETYGVTIDGMLIVGGKFIEEKGIMAAHYGFINQISNHASEIVTDGERTKMTELLGEDCSQIMILGGHEALKKFTTLNPESLDTLWFTKKSLKVKGGFYFQKYTYEGVTFLLVDGFHPQQLAYFTRSDRRVLLMVGHSMTPWKTLRGDLIGSTFPEKATPASIRGQLYARKEEFGYEKVDIANNGIHLSAGPFEGMAELANFVGKALEKDLLMSTDMAKDMIEAGLTQIDIQKAITNPPISLTDGSTKDLYGATEDMEHEEAIRIYKSLPKLDSV